MVIAKLKALQLILAYSLESSLEVTHVIIEAHWKKRSYAYFKWKCKAFCHPWDRASRHTGDSNDSGV